MSRSRSGKISRDVSELSTEEHLVEQAVEAIGEGRPVVLPTDTVYGLCTSPLAPEALARLKGRAADQPVALLASEVEILLELVPELPDPVVRALLPGRLTLIFPNPERRFPLLSAHDTLGVRVPELRGAARRIVTRAGAVAATSANLHGGLDPKRLDDVPAEIRDQAVLVDGGELPGTPSTVVDLTGAEPKILREGAVPAAEVLERLG
jgi:L-threonylcarbamoyladenylate synthase